MCVIQGWNVRNESCSEFWLTKFRFSCFNGDWIITRNMEVHVTDQFRLLITNHEVFEGYPWDHA